MPPKFKKNISDADFKGADNIERESLLHGHSDDDQEEDFFLRGPTSSNRSVTVKGDSKLNSVRVQINEIADVMKNNIGTLIERGDKLDELAEKSDNLFYNADEFNIASKKVKRRMWWRDMKLKIILATVLTVILLLIIIPIIVKNK